MLLFRGKSPVYSLRPAPQEGRLAIVTKRGAGCGGREASSRAFCAWTNDADPPSLKLRRTRAEPGEAFRRRRVSRTAKSCGPDAPMLASSWRNYPLATVAKQPVTGESTKETVKPLRREGRTASAEPVCSCAFSLCAACTRDRGCSVHPAFPAPSLEGRVRPLLRIASALSFLGRRLFAKLGRRSVARMRNCELICDAPAR